MASDNALPRQDGMARLRGRLLADPRLSVAADLPLDHRSELGADSFDLGYRLGPVYDILRNRATKTPLAIAIRGEWGAGKTSAMRWLEARLLEWNGHLEERPDALEKSVRMVPVWFYPWKYRDRENVWRGLIAEVILACLAQTQLQKRNDVLNAQLEQLSFLGRGIRSLLRASTLHVGGGPLKAVVDIEKFTTAKPDAAEEPEAAYLNSYEEALKSWLSRSLSEDDRMVILIDDLDRCLPEVALQVLEALKLYLNMEGVVFVLGVDRTVVDQLVRKHYEELGVDKLKSAEYLDKMFQVEVVLSPSHHETGIFLDSVVADNASWAALENEADEAGNPQDIFRRVILALARRSPREIKRLVNTALIAGEGVEMSARAWREGSAAPTLAQGVQAALIQRILRSRYPEHEHLIGDAVGNAFFAHWSGTVRNLDKLNTDLPPVRLIPEDVLAALEGSASTLSRDEALKQVRDSGDKDLIGSLDGEQFVPYLSLITDPELADLMRVNFSAEAARAVSEDIPPSDLELVERAIRHSLGLREEEVITQEHRDGVETLVLSRTDIIDLRPLAGLANLQSLRLDETQVSDISALAGLANLQQLDLQQSQVRDIAPLAGLVNLQWLDLHWTPVSDIAPLSGLLNLRRLDLHFTRVSDVAPLAKLAMLQDLGLGETKVIDIQPLAKLVNLQSLDLRRTQVSEIAPLAGLAKLQHLVLDQTQVSDEQKESLRNAIPNLEIAG